MCNVEIDAVCTQTPPTPVICAFCSAIHCFHYGFNKLY